MVVINGINGIKGIIYQYTVHKPGSSQIWKVCDRTGSRVTARDDRGRGALARHPGDVGPSMNHVEVAAGEPPQPPQPPQVRRADA
jgi:hypothetical protein